MGEGRPQAMVSVRLLALPSIPSRLREGRKKEEGRLYSTSKTSTASALPPNATVSPAIAPTSARASGAA